MFNKDNNSNREKFSGLILPWLEYLYKLFLDPFINKHNLILDDEFWILLSFTIFSGILYFTKVSILIPISFFVGTFLIFLLNNSSYIRRKVFPKESEKIDDFINKLLNKSIDDILIFIKSYQLDTEQIIKIIEFKNDNYDIYLFILKYQLIQSELIEYLIKNKLYEIIEVDLFSKYILYSLNHISKDNYISLKNLTKDNKIKKILNLCYPFYLKKYSIFRFFANLVIKFRNAINYGGLKLGVFFVSLFITIIIIVNDPSMLQIHSTVPNVNLLNQIMGNVFAIMMVVAIFGLIILTIVKFIFRIYRFVIYLFAPKE